MIGEEKEMIYKQLNFLGSELIEEVLRSSEIQRFPKGTELLKESQYVQVLPLVLDGLVKVFSRFEERELLLYYIQANQSCIMSFSACLQEHPSRIFALTEEDSTILLIPADKIPSWLKSYPKLNLLFYEQYDLRYSELLDTIHHILLNKMDQRLYDYLLEKARLTGHHEFKLSHVQIANELGTVREVISRVMKKLEQEQKVEQHAGIIKILS
ncbi:MAG: Crp/Fnr family transcriptional regulator [Bacteroidetes bacterium]|nr:MAG: Crp/Fnr family transcriptional regulator [Bacteroidota bacterium]